MTLGLTDLPAMDYARREQRLRERILEAGCNALLVTKLVHVRYLTGFTGSAGMLLVLRDGLLFVTDGRYRHQATEQLAASGVDARLEIGLSSEAQRDIVAAAARGTPRMGLESHHVSWAQQRDMASSWFPDAELIPTEGVVDDLRRAKDAGEIARIEAAAAIATTALERIRGRLLDRPTEAEFALELDTEMRRLGASGPSFDTIVASGPNGAKPHHRPGPRRVVDGDLVVLDYGAKVDGYCSDMTRTVVIGAPSPAQQRMLDIVTEAQAAGVAAVRAGVAGADVDRTCRSIIEAAGWGEAFGHGTGHGVGLEIHEDPRVAATSAATLAAGDVVTVEPGVYLPEHGGVRVEDTVVVTPDGCLPLTHAPKDPAWPSRPTT